VTPDLHELAMAAGRGDRLAFDALVRALHQPVWRFAYRLTWNRDLADEAAQETWVRAVRGLARFRGDASVLTWLLAITRRVVAHLLHEQRRDALPVLPPPSWTSPDLVEVELELDRLPPPLHQALILTRVAGFTYEETARVAGVKLGTVRSRVSRARAALTAALDAETRPARPRIQAPMAW
jgi:RNA polymerase sigma-70 factor (ECF subfamily)